MQTGEWERTWDLGAVISLQKNRYRGFGTGSIPAVMSLVAAALLAESMEENDVGRETRRIGV